MLRSIAFRAIVSIATVLLAASGQSKDAPVAFQTTGGDAWTFRKSIELMVDVERCDGIAVSSPRASKNLQPTEPRVTVELPLAAGDNEIRAACHGAGAVQGEAAQQWRVRLRDAPRASIQSSLTERGLLLEAGSSRPAPTGPQSQLHFDWRGRADNAAGLSGLPGQGQRILVPSPNVNGEFYVTLRVTDEAGRFDESTIAIEADAGAWDSIDPVLGQPSWIDHAIVYGVVPQLFGPRGLADVTARLDQLQALGVNTLWLSPVTASPPADFGYAVIDHFRVKDRIGSNSDLRELVRSAHTRDMRVLLDFVPNHMSKEHAYFEDAVARAQKSPYFDFFERTATGDAAHYFDWRHLPNLNYDHPEVQNLVIEAFAYWVREFDVDGFRVDVAWGPRQREPEFWPRWRAELKRIKPDLLLIAEASARDGYYGQNGFDAAYDWTEQLGEWAWRDAFEAPERVAEKLREAITRSASTARVLRFLENNDTGARFVTRHGPATTRVAAAMLLTLPGIPALYTGQEIGAAYQPYGKAEPIRWNEDTYGLREWYARLIALRQSEAALRSTDIRMIDAGPATVLAYLRTGSADAAPLLVLLNYSSEPERLPADVIRAAVGPRASDLLGQGEIKLESGTADFLLRGDEAMVLKGK